MFTVICVLMFFGIAKKVFGATWFLMMGLFMFAGTFGYWLPVGMKHGTDQETGDQVVAA